MAGWEDKLAEQLKTVVPAASAGDRPADPLLQAYADTVNRFTESIARVAQAAGTAVEDHADDSAGRHRWTFGANVLSLRLDRPAGRFFVTADVGRDLAIEEISVAGGQLVDGRGRPLTVEELAQRFVSLLFGLG